MRNENNVFLLAGIVIFAALSRLLPHPDNFTIMGSLALFAGTYFNTRKAAFLIPLLSLFISDLIFELLFRTGFSATNGLHDTLIYVYAAFMLNVMIGFWVKEKIGFLRIALGGFIGSVLFFIITNFGVWMSGFYGFSIEGLMNCYIAAIPFYRYSVSGDAFYMVLLFGSMEMIKYKLPQLAFAKH